jgi:DNA polymerase
MSLEFKFSEALEDPAKQAELERLFPAADFAGSGMPPPGPDFVRHAIDLGDVIDEAALKKKKEIKISKHVDYLYRRAMYDPHFSIKIMGKRGQFDASWLPGHLIGRPELPTSPPIEYGPKPARVMIVSKIPGIDNLRFGLGFAGAGVEHLQTALQDCDVMPEEYAKWFITFACKFGAPTADTDTIQSSWLKDCAPLLAQELRLVKPDFILCLGADATKAVMGSAVKLNGRVGVIKVPDASGEREIQVMTALHPAYVARRPEAYEDFLGQIRRFVALLRNTLVTEEVVDHIEIYTEAALAETIDAMIADRDPNANIIAVDCEWHGEYPTESGAYLRTIQISNKDCWARTIVLRYEGGEEAFSPDLDAARRQLLRLLKSTPERHVRVGGHFLRADLPWLIDFGVDVRPEYAPATDPEDRLRGGWDTSLTYHAYNETAKYGLDECSMRFTSAPTYWARLDKWKKDYCKQNKIKAGDMGGYGNCPSHILHPYANYDADVTRRIMMRFYGTNGRDGLLAADMYGNDCWLPYWVAHQASLAFLEMEMTGLVIDRDRADELTQLFMLTQEKLLEEVREELNWPEFNPKSHPQLAVALFGRTFVKNFTNSVVVPPTAILLDLMPIKTTGKRPKLWRDLPHAAKSSSPPSTDKESR